MPELPEAAYDRGHLAGEIAARLDGHDKHFTDINGQIKRLITEVHDLVLAVQRLADQGIADAKTRVSTAEAVEKARMEAAATLETERVIRRDRSESAWSPVAKVIAVVGVVLGAITTMIGLIIGIKALVGR